MFSPHLGLGTGRGSWDPRRDGEAKVGCALHLCH